MKLVFRKNDQEEITVLQSFHGDERNFVYTDMIKVLLKTGELEAPVIEGDFTEEEKRSINNMVNEINKVTKETLKANAGSARPSTDEHSGLMASSHIDSRDF